MGGGGHVVVVIFSDFVFSVLSKGTMTLLGYKYVLSPT